MAEQSAALKLIDDLAYARFVGFVIGQADIYEIGCIDAREAMKRIVKRCAEFKRDILKEEST